MEFFFSVFFLLFYYIRPQDWVEGMAGTNLIKPIVACWLFALVAFRSRNSPFPGLLKTPHDWIMMAYLGYIVWFGGGSLMGVLPYFAFYTLTVQSVNTWPRMLSYLKWWNIALIVVAFFAVLSLHGLDLTGAKEITARFVGRLAIGTWLHNNPNALGHTVVAILPLGYLLYFWKRAMSYRLFVFPAMAILAGYCLWETESKGSYVVGGILVTCLFVIGRPKMVQVLVIATAMTLGFSALSFLPRMSQMGNLRADQGVQGRLMAWEMARNVAERYPNGEGWRTFIAHIPWRDGDHYMMITKSTHSSYVKIAADLGKYGLFLYLAGLWTAAHSVLAMKSRSEIQERCRRAIFLLVIANLASGWMINREYHTEYFLIIAAAAAMHRLHKGEELAMRKEAAEASKGEEEDSPPEVEPERPQLTPIPTPAFSSSLDTSPLIRKPLWNRFGILDLATCMVITWLTFWTWDYILENI